MGIKLVNKNMHISTITMIITITITITKMIIITITMIKMMMIIMKSN